MRRFPDNTPVDIVLRACWMRDFTVLETLEALHQCGHDLSAVGVEAAFEEFQGDMERAFGTPVWRQ